MLHGMEPKGIISIIFSGKNG